MHYVNTLIQILAVLLILTPNIVTTSVLVSYLGKTVSFGLPIKQQLAEACWLAKLDTTVIFTMKGGPVETLFFLLTIN